MSYRAGTTITLSTEPLGVTGLVGTITAALVTLPAGASAIPATTTGISEAPAGSTVYAWTIALPATLAIGDYGVRWVAPGRNAAETIHVLAAGTPAIYATTADLTAHDLAGLVASLALPAASVVALLARAERDVDRVLGPLPARADTGLKLDPATDLTVPQRAALARAVSEQALWLLRGAIMDPTPERAVKKVTGPDFSTEYDTAPVANGATVDRHLAPGVGRELAPLAWLRPFGARAHA